MASVLKFKFLILIRSFTPRYSASPYRGYQAQVSLTNIMNRTDIVEEGNT